MILNVAVEREGKKDVLWHSSSPLISSPPWHPSLSYYLLCLPACVPLSVTSSSLLKPPFLSEYLIPRGWAALLFLQEIGAQGQGESSSAKCLESFSAVSTRTNSSSLLLNGSPILTPTLTFLMLPPQLCCRHRPPVPRCDSVRGVGRVYVQACLSGRSCQKPRFPLWNNWFNKLPAMFHSKEVAGAKRGRQSQEIN